ncbi:PREDICTED: trifunctional purine biosynthetic protein adenosine-3-like isoform X4 [Gavialis gangeticus]|uniref:trifunctional purine biosynthetic protein adenosine-3-like isoform X4 n=1 Tax=Gavialis gangeticus TaxID=94835 RepID=UPI00092EDDDA|nr:PREDICTED: trifunctional purine biosynthetic protein adenosine-3-like isoform X4 [Gavialis gangeticus]
MADRVLVIGNGSREHALAWKLAQSPHVKQVLVAPGNAGTAGDGKISNSAVLVSNQAILAQFCKDHNIGLVIVGQEDLLATGIVDYLMSGGVRCFGPTAKAAQLETSLGFSKAFLDRHGIPAARWKAFTNPQEAYRFVNSTDFPALVVKAGGPAARKEVIIAASKEEACEAVQKMMQENMFGESGEMVVVEELLKGEELSCLCFTDGVTVAPMPLAQVHRYLMDGDRGPNTEGLGAFCPAPQVPEALLQKIKDAIFQPIVDSMRQEGTPYIGVLQTRLMLTKDGVKVLNFKCHFGDPECQVILPLLKNDFYEVIEAIIEGKLCSLMPVWSENSTAVSVVMISKGYPGDYANGMEITGLLQAKELGVEVFHSGTTVKDGKVVTNGGRVLTVTAVKEDLMSALEEANEGVAAIQFHGAIYWKDVGYPILGFLTQSVGPVCKGRSMETLTSNILIDHCEQPTESNTISGSHSELEGFAGLFDLRASGYDDPILVSRTKGLGTKLQIAQVCKKHNTVGQDLVAMCINDILAQGAEPLFFLDYFAYSKLDAEVTQVIKEGIADACRRAGCILLGTEIAKMPGMYSLSEYDLAGFVVGAVERREMLLQLERIADGDVVIGLASSGIHSSGFNLVRKILLMSSLHYTAPVPGGCGDQTLGELLLTPVNMYSKSLLPVFRSGCVKSCAIIAEGGLMKSIPRILPESCGVVLDAYSWKIPQIFSWLHNEGNLSEEEMAQAFNCGIGAVLVVQKELAKQVLMDIQRHEEAICSCESQESPESLAVAWIPVSAKCCSLGQSPPAQKEQSESSCSHLWSSLAALIAYTKESASCAQVALVISNKPGVEELRNAARAGIPTRVIDHKLYGSRSEFDGTIDRVLEEFSVELICLAGFMRILSSTFLRKWSGKILNVYPSLSPPVKGGNAYKPVLQPGLKVTGCTVHFVLEESSAGAVIHQELIPVKVDDTEETLSERLREAECRAFPIALQLVAKGTVQLGADGKTCCKPEGQQLIHQGTSEGRNSSRGLEQVDRQ